MSMSMMLTVWVGVLLASGASGFTLPPRPRHIHLAANGGGGGARLLGVVVYGIPDDMEELRRDREENDFLAIAQSMGE